MERFQPQASTSSSGVMKVGDFRFDSDEDEDEDDAKLASEVGEFEKDLALISHYEKVVLGHQNAEEPQSQSDLEVALALNRKLDKQVRLLEKHLSEKFSLCEARLVKLNDFLDNTVELPGKKRYFMYVRCGYPYFKGKDLFAAPYNEDAIMMRNAGMFKFHDPVRQWSDKDKTLLEKIMLDMSRSIRTKDIIQQINNLKRINLNCDSPQSNENEIADLQRYLAEVKNLPIKEVALPIEQEYDWDLIADLLPNVNAHSVNEVRNLWRLYLHPNVHKDPWTREESRKLKELAAVHNEQDWDAIAQELSTNRSAYQCFIFFKSEINRVHKGVKWTPEEDINLREVIDTCRIGEYIPWSKVKYFIGNKTRRQIYNRYCDSILIKKHGQFSAEEDRIIWACMKRYGMNVRRFENALPSRTVKQIRQRCLSLKLTRLDWSHAEDRKLLKLMKNHKHSKYPFSELAKHFPNRNRAQLRQRFTVLDRWSKLNPNASIVNAPRRFPKNVTEKIKKIEEASEDLNIEEVLDSNKVAIKLEKVQTDLTEQEKKYDNNLIDSKLLAFFIAEEMKKNLGETASSPDNTVDVLRVLKADLNEGTFDELKKDEFPDADLLHTLWIAPEPVKPVVARKTYGRKSSIPESVVPTSPDDIMLLPPNRQNIAGMKALLAFIYSHTNLFRCKLRKHFSRRVDEQNESVKLWLRRFCSLFYWPSLALDNVCTVENTFEVID